MPQGLNELFDLTGKTALVTGASSGFGWSFAHVLAAAGANVVVGARRFDRLEELCAEITAAGGRSLPVQMNVTDRDSVAAAYDAAERHFGVVSLIVNNAGISRAGYLLQTSESDWDAIMNTNLKAVWVVAAEGVQRMIAANTAGSIINIASLLAFGTSKALGPYMAAKAGVVHLTRAMALEWAANSIRVNAIAPGYFPTEMSGNYFKSPQGREMIGRIPQKRVGEIAELSGPLLLLASAASSYMTGTTVTVDGGHLCQSA